MKSYLPFSILFVALSTLSGINFSSSRTEIESYTAEELETKTVDLGKLLFFDGNLSNPTGKSCASCHSPNTAFSDPNNAFVSTGVFNLKGQRNTPSINYMAFSPVFSKDEEGAYFGGQFWDGRAKDLCEQAKGPLLNHIEMNNSSKRMVVEAVKNGNYSQLFKAVYGENVFQNTEIAFQSIAQAIEAYERSSELNSFTSKFDYYLAGKVKLTALEKKGMQLFNDPKKANCVACHISSADETSGKVLFTDFTYDNLGIPKNPLLASKEIDLGLGKIMNSQEENGKFKVPTLRNIALTAPYFHNGSFKTLEEVVEFYSDRDSGKFGKPEVEENVNHEELGNLHLTKEEIKAIVAFMFTLTDGFQVPLK